MSTDIPLKAYGVTSSVDTVKLATGETVSSVTQSRFVREVIKRPPLRINKPNSSGYRSPSDYFARTSAKVTEQNSVHASDAWVARCGLSGESKPSWGEFYRYSGEVAGIIRKPSMALVNRQDVLHRLYSNVHAEKMDVSMALAEFGQSVNTFQTAAMRVLRSMDTVRLKHRRSFDYLMHGRVTDRRITDAFLRDTQSIYLSWKYGINPTLSDIRGFTEMWDPDATDPSINGAFFLTARASSKSKRLTTCRVEVTQSTAATGNVPAEIVNEIAMRLDYRINNSTLRGLNRYGIGLTSLPTVVFDKTPFSFVLNMLVPISETIKAWGATQGTSTLGFTETDYQSLNLRYGSFSSANGAVIGVTPQSYVNMVRRAGPNGPPAYPYVRNPVKTGNLASVLALATTLRKPEELKR